MITERGWMELLASRKAFAPKKFWASILLGLLGFVGAFFSLNFTLPPLTVSIIWSYAFPLAAGIAYGARYGFIAGLLGLAALFPFWIWSANGWANIIAASMLAIWYAWHGYCAEKRSSTVSVWNHPLVAQIPFAILYAVTIRYGYPLVCKSNPPFWSPDAVTTIPVNVLDSIIIKSTFNMYLMVLVAMCLLIVPQVRRVLNLPVQKYSRDNGKVLLATFLVAVFLWSVLLILDRMFVSRDSPGNPLSFVLPHETIALLVLITSGMIAGYFIARYLEIRRQAEEALRESEYRYRAFFEEGPDGVVILDPETGCFIEFNDQVCRQLGYSREEFAQLCLPDIEASETAQEVHAHLRKVVREGRDDFETRQRTKQGEIRHVQVTAQIADVGMRPFYHCIWRDVTETKRAEAARRLDESRLEALLQLNQMTGATLHEITEFAMEEAVRLTQSTIGYVAFMNRDETVLTMHAWSRLAMQECQINEKPLTYPVHKTGLWGEAVRQRRPILTNDYPASNPLKRGTPKGHVSIQRHMNVPIFEGDRIVIVAGVGNKPTDYDETDARQLTLLMTGMWRIVQRKRGEEALRESQERFQELAELLPETVFEMDAGGLITFVNQNAYAHFGYSVEDLERGLNGFNLLSPEDRPRALENIKRVMAGERIGLNEYSALRKDGSTFPAILHSSAKLRDGKAVGIRGIVIDITENKKLESQLRQAHKMEAVGTLAGGIAHDFNNLLQAVNGYAELLLLTKTEGEEGYRELLEIERAAKRGAELTRQLLTFSRKIESKLQLVDLNRITDDVRLLLERTIPKMIRIELHLMENLHAVNADASQMEQVLMNLAVNARDAMPDGGCLSIETKNVTLGEEYRRTQPELTPGNYVLLSVADTGHGMDESTLEHIFDPFFTTKEVGRGTGLGLAMVYGIVKNHYGYVTCKSKLGEGTRFEILLPSFEHFETTQVTSPAEIGERGGHETILLVDDDKSVRKLGETILQKFGYTVLTAPDGESALRAYGERGEKIDLVILDLIMPGIGGRQCLKKILEINPQAKVVIASGYSIDGEPASAAESGAKAFVRKPYNVQEMLTVIREVLD